MSQFDEHGNWHPPRDRSPTLAAQQSPTIPADALNRLKNEQTLMRVVAEHNERALLVEIQRLTAERDAIAAGAAASQQQGLAVIERLHNENTALRAEVEWLKTPAIDVWNLAEWLAKNGLLHYHPACHRPDRTHGPAWVLRTPYMVNGDSCEAWHADSSIGLVRSFFAASAAPKEG
jgi:hypothetical protein